MAARYEATVPTGLELIAQDEVQQKLGAKTEIRKGRVFLESEKPVDQILELKSINNLFVVIHEKTLADEELPENADELEIILKAVGDECKWGLGLSKWREASKFNKSEISEIMTNAANLRSVQPYFRISSNRQGKKHKFTSPEICARMGNVVNERFGWPIKMKGYDLEIYTNLNENYLYVTITLTPIGLDCRRIVSSGYTTLKGVYCYAMLKLADIQEGDIVVDPMAGSGAIPVENMAAWVDKEWLAFTLGSDLCEQIVSKSKINMSIFGAPKVPPSNLFISDLTRGCLKEGSIDVIVSDLPFGRRHGNKYLNRNLYPALFKEFSRVLRLKSGRAVLLTQDFKSINIARDSLKDYFIQKACNFVKVGDLNCYIYLFSRSDVPFTH